MGMFSAPPPTAMSIAHWPVGLRQSRKIEEMVAGGGAAIRTGMVMGESDGSTEKWERMSRHGKLDSERFQRERVCYTHAIILPVSISGIFGLELCLTTTRTAIQKAERGGILALETMVETLQEMLLDSSRSASPCAAYDFPIAKE